MAQSVEQQTLDLSSGLDLGVMSSSPVFGSTLSLLKRKKRPHRLQVRFGGGQYGAGPSVWRSRSRKCPNTVEVLPLPCLDFRIILSALSPLTGASVLACHVMLRALSQPPFLLCFPTETLLAKESGHLHDIISGISGRTATFSLK